MSEDIELREAQLVFVQLQAWWSDERQRNPKLMREIEQAEETVYGSAGTCAP